MTTTVSIIHEGPDHHDIEVVTADPISGKVSGYAYRLSPGMKATLYVHQNQGIAIREIAKLPAQDAAAGGIGAVGVNIAPHIPDSNITFDEFVQYGRDNGANIVNGMPWSFTYNGHAVTHENDQCYLITAPGVPDTMFFRPGDMLLTRNGKLSVVSPAQ